jgi:hypothetical protein
MVDRSSISLAARAAGLTGPAVLRRMVSASIWGWVSLAAVPACKARDDPLEPGDAHVRAAADPCGEVIGDRMLLLCGPRV